MKLCLNCHVHYASSITDCPACGFGPVLVDGFRAYASDLAQGGSGFKSSYFQELAHLEEVNFWFRSRNRIILWALEEYCQNFRSFLEIGCGNGYVLTGVSKRFPHATLHGSEIFTAGLGFAANRLPAVNLMQMDARNIPFAEEFDVIGAFDVLEHIEADERVLGQIHAALMPHGFMLLTVPQHTWLWSPLDEYACHIRRYAASGLHKKIEAAGFQIVRTTSFVTALLPAMMLSRFFQRRWTADRFDATAELKISPWLNSIFGKILGAELVCIKKGINLPVGGSRLIVARKISNLVTTSQEGA